MSKAVIGRPEVTLDNLADLGLHCVLPDVDSRCNNISYKNGRRSHSLAKAKFYFLFQVLISI